MKQYGLIYYFEGFGLANLLDVFIMKQRALDADDQNTKTVFWIMFEKASIILCLVIVLSICLALNLNLVTTGIIVGLSLGPIVYAHYYFIYIRPVIREKIDE